MNEDLTHGIEDTRVDRTTLEEHLVQPLRRTVAGCRRSLSQILTTIEDATTDSVILQKTARSILSSSRRLTCERKKRQKRIPQGSFIMDLVDFYDHHLKNLLGSIVFPLNVIEEAQKKSDAMTMQAMQEILIRRLADLISLEKEGFEASIRQTSISSTAALKQLLVSMQLPDDRVPFEKEITGDWSKGYSMTWTLFKTIMEELLNNAHDAAVQNGGSISMNCRQEDSRIVCTVHDTAGGIPAEIEESVFENGFTTKKERGGTGKGLFLMKKVTSQIGGSISVATDVEQGWTTFTLELPVWPNRR